MKISKCNGFFKCKSRALPWSLHFGTGISTYIIGYTNASWTLKADIACVYFTKLLNYMKHNGVTKIVPRLDPESDIKCEAFTGGLSSGTVKIVVSKEIDSIYIL